MKKTFFYREKYNITGLWEHTKHYHELVFEYEGETVRLTTDAVFTPQTEPWLDRLAVLGIKDYVEQKQLDEAFLRLTAGGKKKE